ncbi:MAG: putative cystathionine beta-synthase [Candidatus Heimdallarchaeota archaeon LC_2]|nr:MAG: putative cystathionine beta-synthase [Candidatus Heimdallarchaeota archaeon LC_2]
MNEVNPPKAVESIVETIGNTPMVKLHTFSDLKGKYYAKLESFNPGGSSKDRIGITIVEQAEKEGLLKPGGTIIEATSGNTGLGLALLGIKKGYNVILIMPDKMSPAKMNVVKAMGCEVIVCPTEVEPDDPRSYYSVAKKVAKDTPGSFYANQYHNDANPLAHYLSTGPEIWKQTQGKITHFIAGLGTGGTISGTAKFLKEKNPDIKIIGVDPLGSILAHFHRTKNTDIDAKGYKVEGVGEDIIPSNVDFDLIDHVVTVTDKESFDWTWRLAREDGMLVGGSSGLAVAGANLYFEDNQQDEVLTVILLPDTGERYIDKIFSEAWLRSNGFLEKITTLKELVFSKAANLPPLITLSTQDTLIDAYDKIDKFKINQVLIETKDKYIQLLTKSVVYNALLSDQPHNTKIGKLELIDVNFMDIETDYTIAKVALVEKEVIIITRSESPIGIITRQDLIDNTNIRESDL